MGTENWSSSWLAAPLLVVLVVATALIVKEHLGPTNVSLDKSPFYIRCVMELAVASASVGAGACGGWSMDNKRRGHLDGMGCDSLLPESVLGYLGTYILRERGQVQFISAGPKQGTQAALGRRGTRLPRYSSLAVTARVHELVLGLLLLAPGVFPPLEVYLGTSRT